MKDTIINLSQRDIPPAWYNVAADLPGSLPPPLNPATGAPIDPSALARIFPMKLIEQEVCADRWVDIPTEVLDIYHLWRPTPLVRATALEEYLGTPARIYFKNESVSPAGSHKPNTAVAQAYYNKKAGVERLATETGAGQWGSALSFACCKFGLKCKVYMVKVTFEQKPYRKLLMKTWGADIVASPSCDTNTGRAILAKDPNCSGSLGIAISEAGRGRRHPRAHQLLPGQRAQPRPAAPDRHRPGGQEAARSRLARTARRRDRLRRRRQQPGRHDLPVRARQEEERQDRA